MNWQEPSDLEIFPKPALGEWKQYNNLTSMVLDLNAKNVEYLLVPTSVANYLKEQDDSLTVAPGGAGVPTEIRMAVRAEDTELHELLQEGIQTSREDGSLDDLIDTYITNVSVKTDADTAQEEAETTYVVGVTGDLPPMDYVDADGTPAGFNVALMDAIAEKMDVSFSFVQVEADARLSALSSGTIDVIFWYGNVQGYTTERDDLLITDEYYLDDISYVTKYFDMDKIQEAMEKMQDSSPKTESPVEGKKVAYIMYMSPSEIFEMWSEAFAETAEALGMEAEIFFCGDSDEEWKNTISECASEGYDGLLVSHGGTDYAWEFLSGVAEEYPNLKIATFDTSFQDGDGKTQTIDGVVQLFQQDSGLAAVLVEEILAMYPDKAESGEAVNILQVQEENYIIAFDRRQSGYQLYEATGQIRTLEQIAPTDHLNPTESMQEVAENVISKYEEGEIDAIWCSYDAYAQGVYQALKALGSEIPMVSVDICNEDIRFMEEGLNWKACATTNWMSNGEFACRVLALEMAEQYEDIQAASSYYENLGMWMEIPSVLITQEQVMSGEDITVENLSDVADAAYMDKSWMPSCDWMDAALGDGQ